MFVLQLITIKLNVFKGHTDDANSYPLFHNDSLECHSSQQQDISAAFIYPSKQNCTIHSSNWTSSHFSFL